MLNLKTLLRKILPHVPAKKVLLSEMSTAYHVVCEPPPVGLTMREMTQEEMQLYSRCPLKMEDVDLLQSDFYDKVSAIQQWLISTVHVYVHVRVFFLAAWNGSLC